MCPSGGVDPNIARQIAQRSGIPDSRTAYTVNKACGSGLKAIINGFTSIVMGDNGVVLTGGEHEPYTVPPDANRVGLSMGHTEIIDGNHQDGYFCPMAGKLMGATAEDLAKKLSISRDEQMRMHWNRSVAPRWQSRRAFLKMKSFR